jgi:SAM-dependent methyltransferase
MVERAEERRNGKRQTRYWLSGSGRDALAALRRLAGTDAGPRSWVTLDAPPPDFDPTVPSIARIYDYVLGGKDNFEVDRVAGDEFVSLMPTIVTTIRAGRPVLDRMIRYLVANGVRQFLDIGAGLPTAARTHAVAQAADPRCRVVYVDNDPMVLAHARALLMSTPEGSTDYIHADLRDPGTIVTEAARTLDLSEPVTIILSGILHLIPDSDDPQGIVTQLLGAISAGSYLILAHPASDITTGAPAATGKLSLRLTQPVTFRDRDAIGRFLDGLEILPPGLVQPQQWRPEPGTPDPGPLAVWCALARKQ